MACRECQGTNGTVAEQTGALIVVRCDACGAETTFHLSPGPTLEDLRDFKPPEPGAPYRL